MVVVFVVVGPRPVVVLDARSPHVQAASIIELMSCRVSTVTGMGWDGT